MIRKIVQQEVRWPSPLPTLSLQQTFLLGNVPALQKKAGHGVCRLGFHQQRKVGSEPSGLFLSDAASTPSLQAAKILITKHRQGKWRYLDIVPCLYSDEVSCLPELRVNIASGFVFYLHIKLGMNLLMSP